MVNAIKAMYQSRSSKNQTPRQDKMCKRFIGKIP